MSELTLEAANAGPSYRRMTPAVERGLHYAIAQLEIDAQPHARVEYEHEEPVIVSRTLDNAADLIAAANWLRYQLGKRE